MKPCKSSATILTDSGSAPDCVHLVAQRALTDRIDPLVADYLVMQEFVIVEMRRLA
jgi:hypothetical protein